MKHPVAAFLICLTVVSSLLAKDRGWLRISVTAGKKTIPLHFVVTDPRGQREGRTSDSAPYIGEQSGASYDIESLTMGNSGTAVKCVSYTKNFMSYGVYTLTIYGLKTTTYSYNVTTKDLELNNNSPVPDASLDVLPAGKTSTYNIQYDPTSGGEKTSIEKVVTYDTLRQDLLAAKELKGGKSGELINQLTQKINSTEKLPPPGQKKSLEALLQKLINQSGQLIHPQISVIIQQDVKTLLRHL